MSEPSICILFDAIRAVLKNEKISMDDNRLVTADCLEEALDLANKHDISHFIIQGVSKVSDEFLSKTNKQNLLLAVSRYEKGNYELLRICEVFEKNRIAYLPLKGSVLRKYYPEPWMRTNCDIDILVHKDDLSHAVECLVNELEYEVRGQFTHDASLFSKSNVHIELHFDLMESTISRDSAAILENVWHSSHPKEKYQYCYEMSDDMQYFYHIAHMAKHFENGGCGIRPFIDLWILDNIDGVDYKKRDELLLKGGLLKFANSARKLCRIWFEKEEHDLISKEMENYVLCGGVYGNMKNRIIVNQLKKGGRIKYAMSKIFIPYDIIKYHYPILNKHRWLTPIMEVRRWCKLIFCGHLRRTTNELRCNNNITKTETANMQMFLKNIGL